MMQPRREHRSERPAIWDVSNPVERERQSLRSRLSNRKSRSASGTDSPSESGPNVSLRQRLAEKGPRKSSKKK